MRNTLTHIETDYLVIGSGAVGLAFADTLLDETDSHITIVDKHGQPGGHWNDAYPFVRLHQPSAFYGVNSLPLGSNQKDLSGLNKGFYELASGPEISAYFDKVMNKRLLPSGRVDYYPMSNYVGDRTFVSILSGAETRVAVRRKVVDATYYGTAVPSTHVPSYHVAEDVRLSTPNHLPQLWQDKNGRPEYFVIVGAGKTAMDVGLWLINSGANPETISWVMPRDSWLVNRAHTQPGYEFFNETIGGQADAMEAMASATSVNNLFERLEACGQVLRIYPQHQPTMFHYATVSHSEVNVLRNIKNVIRMGHVQRIEAHEVVLDHGRLAVRANTLFIDCSATAVDRRPTVPIFQKHKIVPPIVRMPQPAFSAALVAYVEAHYDSDEMKNQICGAVRFPDSLSGYLPATMANMMNQLKLGKHKMLREWIANSRLDWAGKVLSKVEPANDEQQAILAKYKKYAKGAMSNIQELMAREAAEATQAQ